MTTKQKRRLRHSSVQSKLAKMLECWGSNNIQSVSDVTVRKEKNILGGDRRTDVSLHLRDLFDNKAKYAFEVKTSLSDSIGAHAQLRDYKKAGYHPVFVADARLWSKWNNDDVLKNAKRYAAIMKAHSTESSLWFRSVSGFSDDAYLYSIKRYAEDNRHGFDGDVFETTTKTSTISVDEQTADQLHEMKKRGDSYDDVVRRLISEVTDE